MKKLIVLSLAILLALPLVTFAASMGGVETQGQGKFAVGMDQEFVFDKDMKDFTLETGGDYTDTISVLFDVTPIDVDLTGVEGNMKNKVNIDNMSRSLVKLSYGVFDHLDIFVRLGEANFKQKIKGEAPDSGTWDDPLSIAEGTYTGIVSEEGTFKGKSAFVWGFGAKAVIPFENGWFLGVQGQYLTHKNSIKASMKGKLSGTFEGVDDLGNDITGTYESEGEEMLWNAKATIQEWQIAPYVAKKLGNFIPYFGVKYSDQRLQYKDEDVKIKIKAADNFGLFLGTDYKIGKNFSLNIEGRFIDETAMSLGATYRF